ncbi:ribosome-associated translation inhibitor RaiA [Patescibacteria group bacterium]|nr:ribosome-associated translation inhibitor RaiA [Patescibacteria group bacterium]MCG2695176.1 ribosome-associated translation inhibitor RaiA [Candidatus Parcubacteria bacterium]
MKNIKIKGLNIEMTEAIESYFKNKMDSLDKFLDPNDESIECDARISKIADNQSGDIFKAEVSIHTAGKNFGAVSEKDNLYSAIDDVQYAVTRKITSYKDKKRSIFKRGATEFKRLLKKFY